MKMLITLMLLLPTFNQASAGTNACEMQLKKFLTTTYKSSDLLSNKKVQKASDLFFLNRLERKAFKDYLTSKGKKSFKLDGRTLHSISLRLQKISDKKWLIVRVISDGQMGLSQGMQIYEWNKEGLTAKAQILDDHFNPPVYRCFKSK